MFGFQNYENSLVPELDVLDVGIAIAGALDSALKKDLLHRDIKPGNILFNGQNEPKLVDFGLACSSDTEEDYYGTEIWGTPYYIAPEKINRERETFLSDMYSLAGTLYHALTGHVPFEADSIDDVVAAHVHTARRLLTMLADDAAHEYAIVRAMAKNPAERFQATTNSLWL